MAVTLYNNTATPRTYVSGTITLPASGNVVITSAQQYGLAQDGDLREHCVKGYVYINAGGTLNYASTDALTYLDNILLQNSRLTGATDGTQIGNAGDALKINGAVFGTASVGSAPVNPPLSVSGIDGGGLKRNFLLDSSGKLISADMGTVSPGTAASYSSLAGGQYNSSDPTLTNAQQAALQLTNNGRLKVDATVSSYSTTAVQSWSKKLRYVDMTAIARGASITAASGWNTAFSYSGSGSLISFMLNLETMADWYVRLVVDGDEIFGSAGVSSNDLTSDAVYDFDSSGKSSDEGLGFTHGVYAGAHDTFHWKAPLSYPVSYASSVQVLISRGTGTATKKFKAGLIVLTKET